VRFNPEVESPALAINCSKGFLMNKLIILLRLGKQNL